ncbi:MAG: ERF family protein, partial [Bacillota bacterium]|nr:ERF family protein [Bacillota bacterium]
LEGIKPLLAEVKAIVSLNDTIEMIGDRFYVKAEATFIDTENGDKYSASAYAREDHDKKGMDLAQVTGSVSSYARKYALNGLFCIDDTKDSDATNNHSKETKSKEPNILPGKNEGKQATSADGSCSDCGNTINNAVRTFSEKQFGKPLCRACQQKQQMGAK